MIQINYPKLLVLSNNSFSKSNSNGRTLGSLLHGWPKEKIAQFCISSDGADFEVCNNYFCVTDSDVLKSILSFTPVKRRDLYNSKIINANTKNGYVRYKKTTIKMFARNLAWMVGIWKGNDFFTWLNDFKPEIVLLQNGESFFMHKLAINIAKKYDAKLAIFNTEGYYFFHKDYFPSDGFFGKQLFKIYKKTYNSYFRDFMHKCSKQIYGNLKLKEDYDKEFGNKNSIVVYTSSSLKFSPKLNYNQIPTFSYLGNLGFDRPQALIEFSLVLAEINKDFKLDIYGFAKDKAMEDSLQSYPSIRFHGAITYSQVINVIENSDFLVHAESQDETWLESLKYGFSTKIADSISSGKLFILYASPGIACSQYIIENKAGIFASERGELKEKITKVLNSTEIKSEYEEAALQTSKTNHNPNQNIALMRSYLTK